MKSQNDRETQTYTLYYRKYGLLVVGAFAVAILCFFTTPFNLVASDEKLSTEMIQELPLELKTEKANSLVNTIHKRLQLMPEVARFKWNNTRPILDKEREEALLSQIVLKAEALGVDPKEARDFFRNQMEAAKLIQIEAFNNWANENAYKLEQDAEALSEIRAQIDQINNTLLAELQEILPLMNDPEFQDLLLERANDIMSAQAEEVRRISIDSLLP
ncbi:MAG: gamma subclass chorismate mutase AroQ [Simkaniaceae bacterium]